MLKRRMPERMVWRGPPFLQCTPWKNWLRPGMHLQEGCGANLLSDLWTFRWVSIPAHLLRLLLSRPRLIPPHKILLREFGVLRRIAPAHLISYWHGASSAHHVDVRRTIGNERATFHARLSTGHKKILASEFICANPSALR